MLQNIRYSRLVTFLHKMRAEWSTGSGEPVDYSIPHPWCAYLRAIYCRSNTKPVRAGM